MHMELYPFESSLRKYFAESPHESHCHIFKGFLPCNRTNSLMQPPVDKLKSPIGGMTPVIFIKFSVEAENK